MHAWECLLVGVQVPCYQPSGKRAVLNSSRHPLWMSRRMRKYEPTEVSSGNEAGLCVDADVCRTAKVGDSSVLWFFYSSPL